MSLPTGIEQFDGIATLAFARLFRAFPNEIDLDGGALAAEYLAAVSGDISEEDHFVVIYGTGDSALNWLANEGYIRFRSDQRVLSGGSSHPKAQLTMRGLSVLRAVPSSVNEDASSGKSFGERAMDAAGAGTKTALGEFSKAVIGGVLGAYVRSGGWG